jgi:GTP cyclohydrolase I
LPAHDDAAANALHAFLTALGLPVDDDPELRDTPARVAKMFRDELLRGYARSPQELLADTFPAHGSNLVTINQIEFQSMCPHHLVPVVGVAHVAYLPAGRIVGFSQVVELIEVLARRLTLQEQLGAQIAGALAEHLGAPFAACALTASQLCMMIRGAKRPNAKVTTYAFAGARQGDPMLKELFLRTFSA